MNRDDYSNGSDPEDCMFSQQVYTCCDSVPPRYLWRPQPVVTIGRHQIPGSIRATRVLRGTDEGS